MVFVILCMSVISSLTVVVYVVLIFVDQPI